jgi:hypothetical protein
MINLPEVTQLLIGQVNSSRFDVLGASWPNLVPGHERKGRCGKSTEHWGRRYHIVPTVTWPGFPSIIRENEQMDQGTDRKLKVCSSPLSHTNSSRDSHTSRVRENILDEEPTTQSSHQQVTHICVASVSLSI